MKLRNAAVKYGRKLAAVGTAIAVLPLQVFAEPELTLDVTPITDVLDEGPEYLILIAGAIFATIGLMFIISKVRQVVKA